MQRLQTLCESKAVQKHRQFGVVQAGTTQGKVHGPHPGPILTLANEGRHHIQWQPVTIQYETNGMWGATEITPKHLSSPGTQHAPLQFQAHGFEDEKTGEHASQHRCRQICIPEVDVWEKQTQINIHIV